MNSFHPIGISYSIACIKLENNIDILLIISSSKYYAITMFRFLWKQTREIKYQREKPKEIHLIKIERDGRCEINYKQTIWSRRKKDTLAITNGNESKITCRVRTTIKRPRSIRPIQRWSTEIITRKRGVNYVTARSTFSVSVCKYAFMCV